VSAPRLVATDLDGTLLHSDGTVTARTRAVLAELDDLGVPVVFTTGRPVRWMEDLWESVGGHGLAICSNGGIVYDVARREVRDFRPVPRAVGMQLADVVRAAVPGTTFAVEHTSGWASERSFPRHPDDADTLRQGAWESIWTDDVVKVLAVHPDLDPEDFWRQVEAAVGTLVTTTWSSTFALVEISAAGVTKATTLAALCDERGIDRDDVLAFGDMPNDLAMLAWAGRPYAVASGHPAVLAAVTGRVLPPEQDGVARELELLFDL